MRTEVIIGLDLGDRISGVWGAGFVALVQVVLSIPIASFAVAAVLFVPVLALTTRRASATEPANVRVRHRPERWALAGGAAFVILVFLVESFLRGYVWDMSNAISWWWQALPLFTASVVIAAVAAAIAMRRARHAVPFLAAQRRTWTSFGPRVLLPFGAAALGLLVATTIGAGAASSADDAGRYVYLDAPLADPSEPPLRLWFYGWAYGVPVLLCSILLVLACWLALRANAERSFIRPDTVEAEKTARRATATSVSRIATAAVLLAMAAAWRLIAKGAVLAPGTVEIAGERSIYLPEWRYAEFATLGLWLAPAIEVAAFLLLLLAVRTGVVRVPSGAMAEAVPA